MATSPYGGFADLSSYRKAVDARMAANADPLSSLIQGFQQGQALQQLPQKMAEDALNKQLALAIQQAQLAKMQRPQVFQTQGGLMVEDATSPTGFRTVAAPVRSTAPKLGRIVVDKPSGRIFEITPEGMRERTLDQALTGSIDQGDGLTEDFLFSDETTTSTPASGTLTPVVPKAPGLKTKNFVEQDGSTHTYSIDGQGNKIKDLGMARAAPVLTPKKTAQEKAPPAKIQDQYLGSQNLFQTAPRLEQKIAELRAAGIKEPNSIEKSIINMAYQDPKGLLSGLTTALATGQIRPEIADLEQLRAEIESNYTTAKAGLSQTASEIKRTIPVAPTRFDSWDRMLSKTKNLKEIAGINVSNINKQYPGFAKTRGVSQQPLDFATEADIPDDLPPGTSITVGGRPAVWE